MIARPCHGLDSLLSTEVKKRTWSVRVLHDLLTPIEGWCICIQVAILNESVEADADGPDVSADTEGVETSSAD